MSRDVYLKCGELPRYFRFGTVNFTNGVANSLAIYKESPYSVFQVIAAAAATVKIQGSNEIATGEGVNSNWVDIGTVTLAAAGTDAVVVNAPWRYVRASVTAATAKTEILMGV